MGGKYEALYHRGEKAALIFWRGWGGAESRKVSRGSRLLW